MADGRVSQEAVEVIMLPTDQLARVSQLAVEAIVLPTNQLARLTQLAVEVIISQPSGRVQGLAVQQC